MERKAPYLKFVKHGRYDKRADSFNGLNLMRPDKAKKMADIRMKAMRVEKKIQKEGVE